MSVTDGSGEPVNFTDDPKGDRVCYPREVVTTHCQLISTLNKLGSKEEAVKYFQKNYKTTEDPVRTL